MNHFILIEPGTTTDNPERWLRLARDRWEALNTRIEAGQAPAHVLARWREDRRVLEAQVRRVKAQMGREVAR